MWNTFKKLFRVLLFRRAASPGGQWGNGVRACDWWRQVQWIHQEISLTGKLLFYLWTKQVEKYRYYIPAVTVVLCKEVRLCSTSVDSGDTWNTLGPAYEFSLNEPQVTVSRFLCIKTINSIVKGKRYIYIVVLSGMKCRHRKLFWCIHMWSWQSYMPMCWNQLYDFFFS